MVLVGSCGGDGDAEEPPQPEGTPPPAGGGLPDDDVIEVDDTEAPERTTTVLDPGRDGDRVELKSATVEGVEQVLTVSVRVRDRTRKRIESPPAARFKVKTQLDIGDDGSTRSLERLASFIPSVPGDPDIEDDEDKPPEVVATEAEEERSLKAEFDAFVHATETTFDRVTKVSIDAHQATHVDWDPLPDEQANGRALVAGVQHALDHLAVEWPQEMLGEGAKWTTTRSVEFFGVPAEQTLEFTLQKWSGSQVEVRANVVYQLQSSKRHDLPTTLLRVTGGTANATLTGRFDRETGVPVEMRLKGVAKVEGEGESGPMKPKPIHFNLRVDEDYLAQNDKRVVLEGEFVQGGLVIGKIDPNAKVWFNRHRVKISDEGDFVIGFGRDVPPRALLSFQLPEGSIERHVVPVRPRIFEPERIDGLPDDMVHLDAATRKTQARSRVKIERVRNRTSGLLAFRSGFVWPVKGRVTSTYGRRRILNGEERGYHWGVDISAPVGRKVKAPAGGKVVYVEMHVPLSGNVVVLDHGHGVTSSFLHLDKILVEEGDEIESGHVIATVGKTGRATGPHLDWRMNLHETRIDPQLLVPSVED